MSRPNPRHDGSYWLDLRRRCLAQEEGAWAELDSELRPVVTSWIGRLSSDRTLVDDLTQEFFLRLYEDGGRRLTLFDPDRGVPLLGYLRVIAIRVHCTWCRSRQGKDRSRWVALSEAGDISAPQEGDPLFAHRMESLFRKLGDGDRTILLMLSEELSYRQIAEELGITEGGVAAKISRARTRLKAILATGGEGPELEGSAVVHTG